MSGTSEEVSLMEKAILFSSVERNISENFGTGNLTVMVYFITPQEKNTAVTGGTIASMERVASTTNVMRLNGKVPGQLEKNCFRN